MVMRPGTSLYQETIIIQHDSLQSLVNDLPHWRYPILVHYTEAVGIDARQPHRRPKETVIMSRDTRYRSDGNVPSNYGEHSLQTPVINVTYHTNLPEKVWTEEVIPKKLPDDRGRPKSVSVKSEELG